ncbi:MAG: DNA methyltransferase [Syntrophobacteraceae bacterium]|nr:DNA methyltransferase [Syntrophobacteraceae bacterium]
MGNANEPKSQRTLANLEVLNGICPYFTMFPLAFPYGYLKRSELKGWVLDPFCGRGTTNFAARLLKLPSIGVDSSPIAAAIADGKMVDTVPEEIDRACAEILTLDTETNQPVGEFWDLCFHPRTLQSILKIRNQLLLDCESPERRALRALLLGILHGPRNKGLPSYLSNQMPRTYAAKPNYAVGFWRKNHLIPYFVDVAELVHRKAVYYFSCQHPKIPYRILCKDSRSMDFSTLGAKFSYIITSPPYYGMRTYVPDQWLRNWFLGGPDKVTYGHTNQIVHSSPYDFAVQLGSIWKSLAKACVPGAKVMIRFGGIHDRKANPKEILLNSISQAKPGIRLLTIRSAGLSSCGKRQAEQFKRSLKKPIEEFDFYLKADGAE